MSLLGAFGSKAPDSRAVLTNRKDKSDFLSKKDICATKKMPGHGLLVNWFRREGFLYRTLYCSHMYSLENFPIGIC